MLSTETSPRRLVVTELVNAHLEVRDQVTRTELKERYDYTAKGIDYVDELEDVAGDDYDAYVAGELDDPAKGALQFMRFDFDAADEAESDAIREYAMDRELSFRTDGRL